MSVAGGRRLLTPTGWWCSTRGHNIPGSSKQVGCFDSKEMVVLTELIDFVFGEMIWFN